MSGDRWGSGGPDDHSTYAPIAAPTPQPDAERVQGKVTAAVRRGAEFGPLAYTQAMTDPTVPHVWQHVTMNILAAALDVDEMARVLFDLDNPDLGDEWRNMAWADMGGSERSEERIKYELRAAALRTALLGSDQ